MMCVGNPTWHPFRERCRPKPHCYQRWPSDCELWSVPSSLEFAESLTILSRNFTLGAYTQRLSYGPAFEFRSNKISPAFEFRSTSAIDSKVSDSKVSALYTADARSSNLQQSPSGLIYAYAEAKELRSFKRGDNKVIAARGTRRNQITDSDYWEGTNSEDIGETEGSSIWDANAENVRRNRPRRTFYSAPEVDQPLSSVPEPNNRSRRKTEWDYDSEPKYNAELEALPNWWQWWRTNSDGDAYDDEDGEDSSWLSLVNMDVKEALLLLRWGLPAAFLLATAVLPWILSNPLIILFAFIIFPSASKFLSPLVKEFLSSIGNPFGSSSSKRRQKQRSSRETARYPNAPYDSGSSGGPTNRGYGYVGSDYEVSREGIRSGDSSISKLGGWDDLVENMSTSDPKSKLSFKRRSNLEKKLAKKEKPFYLRVFLALFPFLRGWGGWL